MPKTGLLLALEPKNGSGDKDEEMDEVEDSDDSSEYEAAFAKLMEALGISPKDESAARDAFDEVVQYCK